MATTGTKTGTAMPIPATGIAVELQAAAIKFARQSIANGAAIFARFTSSGRKFDSAKDSAAFWTSDIAIGAIMSHKADLGTIKPKGVINYITISII